MYYVKKVAAMIATVLLVTLLSFLAFSVIPGDAARLALGTEATDEQVEALREKMGLNENVFVRYGKWVAGAVKGDLGDSSYYKQPVSELMGDKLKVTLILSLLSLVIIIAVSVPVSVLMSLHEGRATERVLTAVGRVLMAVPSFLTGIILIYIFVYNMQLYDRFRFIDYETDPAAFAGFIILPAVALAIPKIAMVTNFLHANLIKEMNKDYTRTLRTMGKSRGYIIWVHALKNAMLPTVTFLGIVATEVLAGSVIIEQVYTIPGLGRLMVQAIGHRDYNVTQAIVLYIAVIVVTVNFVVDLLYRVLDPSVKRGDA
ncbi:MAG: ABC transporter permease [Lachnospiraceae bacterium]|nr:ABC transporter permease [Lachnospiraceae bacterium]